MAKLVLLAITIIFGAAYPVAAQRELNAVLLTPLPKAIYCDREPSCVAAASFRLLETLNSRFKARDTIWLYIMCPENFSPGFWTAQRTYELLINADTSAIRKLPRLSLPQKHPLGMVATARRINLR